MNRRTCLVTLGTAGVASLGGCLGENTDRRPELQIERDGDAESGCLEDELLDFERVWLAPRLAGQLGATSAVQWELDLQASEELYVRITNPDAEFLPHLRIDGPDGSAIVDEPPVDNIYTVQPQRDGRHVVTVSNRRWSEGEVWFVDLYWYSSPGCRR